MTVLGIDISKYQLFDTSPPNAFGWQKAYQAGGRFVMMRSTRTNPDGTIYKDLRLIDYAQNREALLLAGYYAYVRLEFDTIRQADIYLSAVSGLTLARAVIDLEGDPPRGLMPSQAAARLQTWLDRVEAATKQIPIIYTRQSWFDSYIAPSSSWRRYPLWLARYAGIDQSSRPLLDSPWGDGKYKPRDWETWTFWQYTDFGQGELFGAESKQIDLNLFNGTEQNLVDFIGGDPGQQPPPPPPAQGIVFEIQADFLNVRSGPGTGYPVVDQLKLGDQVTPGDVDGLNAWIEIAPGKWACVTLNGRRYMRVKA